jgi:hypothetical protein
MYSMSYNWYVFWLNHWVSVKIIRKMDRNGGKSSLTLGYFKWNTKVWQKNSHGYRGPAWHPFKGASPCRNQHLTESDLPKNWADLLYMCLKKETQTNSQQSLSRELHCMMMHDDACCFRACDICSTQYFWHPYPDPTYYEPNIPQLDLGFSGLWFPAPARLTVMVWSLSLPLKDMYLGPDLKVGACKYLQNPPLDSTWQSMILVVDTWSRVKLSCRVLPCAQSNPWRNPGVFDVGLYSWYPL